MLEGDVFEACGVQASESPKPVGVDRGAWRDVLLENGGHRCRREVRKDLHADATRTVAAPLHGDQDGDRATPLQLSAPSDPRLGTANPGVIDFDFPVEGFACRIDHRSAQFVEHHPGGFISAQAQLSLEQERRYSTLVGRHQVCGPKPQRQRGLRVVQDRPRRQRDLMAARHALPASLFHHGVSALVFASRAPEAIRPATGGQVVLARLFGSKLTLKLAHIRWKGRAWHALTLLIAAC